MGIRGERELPGLMGTPGASGRPASANLGNTAAEYHNFSEGNIREICMSVVKSKFSNTKLNQEKC